MLEMALPAETLRSILNASPDLTLYIETCNGIIRDGGTHAAEKLGYSLGDLIGQPVLSLIHPDDRDRVLNAKAAVDAGEDVRYDCRLRCADGSYVLHLATCRMVGEGYSVLILQDIENFRASDSRLSTLMNLARMTEDIFVASCRNGYVTYANPAVERVHGKQVFVGRHLSEFIEEESWERITDRIRNGETRFTDRIIGLAPDGRRTPLELRTYFDEVEQQWYTVEHDISKLVESEGRMRRMNADLRRQATTDALTGVANRSAFAQAVEAAIVDGDEFSILLLDMDDFKSVNDTLGHAAGDEFLRVVARRLQGAVALQDIVARLGGDEFVIFVPHTGFGEAGLLASRIIEVISEPFKIGGNTISRSCSIGGASWEPGDGFSEVLRKADQAAYRAKHAGRSRFALYEGSSDSRPIDVG